MYLSHLLAERRPISAISEIPPSVLRSPASQDTLFWQACILSDVVEMHLKLGAVCFRKTYKWAGYAETWWDLFKAGVRAGELQLPQRHDQTWEEGGVDMYEPVVSDGHGLVDYLAVAWEERQKRMVELRSSLGAVMGDEKEWQNLKFKDLASQCECWRSIVLV